MTFFFTSIFMILVFWRPQEWLIPWLYGWPLLDAIVFISLLALLVESDQGYVRFPRDVPQVYLLVGLWCAAVMSHLAHTYFAGMMETIPEVFKVCFFTVLLFCVLSKPSRLRAVAFMFVAMACLMAVHAILQEKRGYGFAWQRPLYIPAMLGNPAHTRSMFFGIFEDPNDTAQFLATSIPLAFVIQKRQTFIGFLMACGIATLLMLAVLTTHSRGGMIASVAVFAVMGILLLPARWFPALMMVLLGTALLLCPLSAAYLDMSAHDRVVFWGMANEQFKHNLLFGIGYGMFWQVASERAAHNAFVSCYTTLGVFGYWFWFGLLHLAVLGAWRTRIALRRPESLEQKWMKRFSGLSIAAMTGFCASAYFLSRDFVYPLFFLFALLGAIPYVATRLLPEDHPPLVHVRRDLMVTGTIGALGSIVYIYFSIVLLNRAFYG